MIDDDEPGLDELELLVRSGAYRAIAKRQAFIVQQKLAEIVQPLTENETNAVRGYIAGVQACLRLPAQLKLEIEDRRKSARKR